MCLARYCQLRKSPDGLQKDREMQRLRWAGLSKAQKKVASQKRLRLGHTAKEKAAAAAALAALATILTPTASIPTITFSLPRSQPIRGWVEPPPRHRPRLPPSKLRMPVV
jgi:hypothetical protein